MTKPLSYDPRIANELIEYLSDGMHIEDDGKRDVFHTLRAWCRRPGTPSYRTIYRWIEANPEFARDMEAARHCGADAIAEDTLRIIDLIPRKEKTEFGSRYDAAHVAWMKNRVWQRMQLLKAWHPKRYGDKIELDGKLTHEHAFMEQLEAARRRANERSREDAQVVH